MPHVNELIDFVVSAFIMHPTDNSFIMVKHKKLGGWFPPGGHIEPAELPDEALIREVFEETGLTQDQFTPMAQFSRDLAAYFSHFFNKTNLFSVEAQEKQKTHQPATLLSPAFIDVHNFPPKPGHRHVAFVYLLRAKTAEIKLADGEHDEIAWMTHKQAIEVGVLPSLVAYMYASELMIAIAKPPEGKPNV